MLAGNNKKAFSLIEVLLAVAFFALIITGLVGALLYGQESGALAGNRSRASYLALEGMDAVRNIRADNFTNLTDGNKGLAVSLGNWSFAGSQDTTTLDALDYTRQLVVSTVDAVTKRVTVNVSWQQNPQRTGLVTLDTYLTNWQASKTKNSGVLVYSNGGILSDALQYKTLSEAGSWSSAQSLADIDSGSTNRYARAVKIYASATRDEKIALSRHYNGTTQYIYGQVFNGSSWGNVQLLASWNATTFLDVQNFDGDYLLSGNFLVVYSDNSTTPKYRTWNGSSWSGQSSLPVTGGIPSFVVAKTRPGTNELMAAFFDQSSDTNTCYWNGSAWTLHTEHSAQAPVATKFLADFDWNVNDVTRGALVYCAHSNDRTLDVKVWTANGSGGGAWSGTGSTASQGTGTTRIASVSVSGRAGANEFMICDKNTVPQVVCFRSNFTPAVTVPTNSIIAATTDAGIQRSFDARYENSGGTLGLGVYSDATNIPKYKKYDPTANSWDAASASLSSTGSAVETVKVVAQPGGEDLLVLLGDTSQDLSSQVWDGTNNVFYSSGGKGFSGHGTNGSADEDFWYDFAWDEF